MFKDGLAARVLFSEVFDAHLQVIQVRVPGESGPVEGTAQVKANFLDREFSLYPLRSKDEAGVYEALVGVPYDQEPGELHIDISVVSGQRSWKVTVPFTVKSNKYKKETLKVDPTLANNIPKSVMPRIKRENILIGRVYKRKTQRKFWRTAFDLPVKSDVTSPFGTRRMFNKVKKGFHKGLDLRASVGTPIRAPASGVVVMSKDLYFTGNTVMIDHGYGVVTLYAHLSKFRVKHGQKVKRGQILGLAGATGRVTGPHLHWGAIVHRIKINPLELVRTLQRD